MDNSPVKKIACLLGLAAPLLALASCQDAGTSNSYVAPSPVTVSFYDDSTEPVLVGYGYCIAGNPVDLRLSADYDFLSHDASAQAALENGEYLSFVGWTGKYEDGSAVDLSSVTEDCSVYATFEKDIYSVSFRYYNGASLIREESSEFPSAIESSFEWGAFAGDFAVDYASLTHEESSAEFGKDYTCEGFYFRGYPGSGTFVDFEEVASSLAIEPFIDERGQRDYRLFLLDPSLAEGRHEVGLLSERPVIDLEAAYAEEDALHKVTIKYGETIIETEVRHGAGLDVDALIEGGNYSLSITNEAISSATLLAASASIAENLGTELSYEATYDEDAAPHLAGNPVELTAIYGPAEIDVGLYETLHEVNVYDSDLSGELIGTLSLPAGSTIDLSMLEGADAYEVTVVPDSSSSLEERLSYSIGKEGVAGISLAARSTPAASSLYGASSIAAEEGVSSLLVTGATDVYCEVVGEYDLVISYQRDGGTVSQTVGLVTPGVRLLTGKPVSEESPDGAISYTYPYEYGFHSGRLEGFVDPGLSWSRTVNEAEGQKEIIYTLA